MKDKEEIWDERLQISTVGRDDLIADEYRYPYEPTPYGVLERLADSGLIRVGDRVLDYGCGKGRVDFFLAHMTNARTVGIEYDPRIYQKALDNRQTSIAGEGVELVLGRAEEYEPDAEVRHCYFFNPFSVEILRGVMARLLDSYYAAPREILLYFYYPSDEYIAYLMTVDELDFYDEIECDDLFPVKDRRERILIFSLPDYSDEETE